MTPAERAAAVAIVRPVISNGGGYAAAKEEEVAEVERVVADFNNRYIVVNEAGKAVIFQPTRDPVLNRKYYHRLTTRDLQTFYMNQKVKTANDDKGNSIFKSPADIWLRHPDRRQFIHGVTFDPNGQSQEGVLNLWEGFAVKPAPGNWSLMRDHIEKVICADDEIRIDYLMGWLASMVQFPGKPGEVAVVMQGGQGTGKGTLAKVLMHITGHHGMAISNPKHLVGSFNSHLRDTIFLFADEALFAGDRSQVGVLNALITEPHLTIEAKFSNAIDAPNFLHIMMASNDTWVVPAAMDSRRFFVLKVVDTKKGNHAYFAEIWKQMDAGGYEAMLHDLLNMDLSLFNIRAVPTTEGLENQRKLSLQTTELWWKDCLERGYVYRSKFGLEKHLAVWIPEIATELLFLSYEEFAKKRNERRMLSRETLGKFFTGLGVIARRFRNVIVGERFGDVVSDDFTQRKGEVVRRDRTYGYAIGDLDQARAMFTAAMKFTIHWDGGVSPNEDHEPFS